MTPQLQISHFSSYAPAATRTEAFLVLASSQKIHFMGLSYEASGFASLNFCHVLARCRRSGWEKSQKPDPRDAKDAAGCDACQDLRCDIVGCSSTCLHASPCTWDVVLCQSSAIIGPIFEALNQTTTLQSISSVLTTCA